MSVLIKGMKMPKYCIECKFCSECECAFDDDWNYCPNCGAKMENGEEA